MRNLLVVPLIVANALNFSTIEKRSNDSIQVGFKSRRDIISDMEKLVKEKARIELEEQKKREIEEQKRIEDLRRINLDYYDLRVASGVHVEALNDYLESNTSLGAIADAYVQAEANYSVNAVYLLAITLEESGRGTSDITYSHNNISGTRIRTDNGYEYKYFNDLWECVDYTARNLSYNYLTEGGIYHSGYSLYDVNTRYCFLSDNVTVDRQWAENVQAIADEIYYFIKNKER